MVEFIKTGQLVLFIDSSEGLLGAAQDLLRSYEGFKGEIRSFTSGIDALNLLSRIKTAEG